MSTRDKDQSPPLDKPLERQIITTVGEVQYLVHPQKLGHVSSTGSPSELQDIVPVTGLTVEQFNSPSFFQIIEDFNRLDDVYMYGFNKRIVIIDQSEAKLAADDKTHEIPPHRIHGLFLDVERHLVMPGPYFIYNGGLHQAWRLYPDKLRAFNFGIVPRALHDPQNCAYNLVSALSLDGLHKAIAVPSRLYSGSLSHEKPLSGIRFVVDDLVSMKGVKTTLSHETWTALYPPCQSTSYLIKKLIGWGAVMVGKTKASQFACLHTAWVDASSPKNPRADGYQEALGSAPGAGSALAGYKWVDCAVGVDTLGGFLETAEWYGLFALRLTHNWQYISEMNLASPRLAAVAIMSRSLERVRQVMKSIALQIPQPPRPLPPTPNTIIYFKDLFDEEERRNQKRLAAPFISLFEVELQGGRLDIDLSKRWEQRQPSEANAPGEALDMFMRNCAFQVYCHEFGRKYNRFIQDYNTDEEAIECVEPYWDDAVAYIWEEAQQMSVTNYENNCARIKAFTQWFDKEFESLGSSKMIILPAVVGHQPRSRVDSPSAYAPTAHRMQNWDECLASILQRPQLVLPLGRTHFRSRITRSGESLPLCSSIMGSKDSELPLIDLVLKVMKESNLEVKVEFGKNALLRAREQWQNFEVNGDMAPIPYETRDSAELDADLKRQEEEDLALALKLSREEY